ncbi:MAG TPA: nucleotide-binding protein [Candidatus Wallbacteria bacterium]|nr:nucleotide-binding protein [Candidatus Wallbacteria bacterium]
MDKKHKYVIGIDLGTTNCAISYAEFPENDADKKEVHNFSIAQVTAPGVVEEKPLLPSFMYIASEVEFPGGSLDLPWAKGRHFCVGEFAQKRGAESPKRLISSAKSWLCHGGVSRDAKNLPFASDDDGCEKFSSIEASAKYIEHIKDAWDHKMAAKDKNSAMAKQCIYITVPASFDAAARDLTLKAAELADLSNITLLEEPQAAFYSWINRAGDKWRREVKEGEVVLVFDIGGGTTDFSLIYVGQKDGDLTLNRIAVGNHILLGGDNMDIALANLVRGKLESAGKKIDNWQFQGLWYSARAAKETLLADDKLDRVAVTVLSKGKSVIGGAMKSEILRSEIEKIMLEGFFAQAKSKDMPAKQQGLGITEISLPYASDPAITRHLAKFLNEHVNNENYAKKAGATFIHPDAVLFNGGVMKSGALRDRVIEVVNGWLKGEGAKDIKKLESDSMDLAVARGAAYFGLAKSGHGIRIKGGTAASYYIGLETAMPAVPGMRAPIKALCAVPAKTEEGAKLQIPGKEFGLRVGEKSEFKMFVSTTHKEEAPGTILEEWPEGELIEMTPLETALERKDGMSEDIVPVTIESYVTEIGTIEIWCVSRDGKNRWKLEFNIRESE